MSTQERLNIMDSFVAGAKKGTNLVFAGVIPNVIFAFVLLEFLNLSGIMKLLSTLLAPIMAIWGLPGVAALPLATSFAGLTGALVTAAKLFVDGALTQNQAFAILPAIFLMGSSVMYTGRLLAVAGISSRQFKYFYIINISNALVSIFIMNILIGLL